MVHALFRTGSTFLFQKFREFPDWICYYEPFHEDVAHWSAANLDRARFTHSGGAYGHAKSNAKTWLFEEYEPLVAAYPRGIATASRDFSYATFFGGCEERVVAYLGDLLQNSKTANTLFQFNRSALRQRMLKRLFPKASHFYLRRNLDDIWGSYLKYVNNGVPGFIRNHLAAFSLNAEHPLSRSLNEHMPIVDAPNIRWFHSMFGEVCNQYSLEQHYLLHAVLWYAAERENELAGNSVIDIGEIEQKPLFRRGVELEFYGLGAPISFEDSRIARYKDIDLRIDRARRLALKALAKRIVDSWEPMPHSDEGRSDGDIGAAPGTPLPGPASREDIARIFALHAERNAVAHDPNALAVEVSEPDPEKLRESFHLFRQPVVDTVAEAPLLCVDESADLDQLADSGFFVGGFDRVEKNHIWMNGQLAIVRFRAEQTDRPLRLRIRFRHQRVLAAEDNIATILANGEIVGQLPTTARYESYEISLDQAFFDAENSEYWIGFHSRGTVYINRCLSLDFAVFELVGN